MSRPMQALSRANDVKSRRNALRRNVASRELDAADLILGSWPCIETAMVGKVLTWLPSVSVSYAERVCERAEVSYGRSFGALTSRQRRALVEAIAAMRPGVLK